MPPLQNSILGSGKEKEMSKKIEMATGRKFGRLALVAEKGKTKSGEVIWECLCACGNIKKVPGSALRSDRVRSCGCLNKETAQKRFTTHGMSHNPTYNSWYAMLQRCNNPKNKGYKNYGGRGISVCKQWYKFSSFFKDMGERPKGLTIERIQNNLGYSKENCCWATYTEQSHNRRVLEKKKIKTKGVYWHKRIGKYQVAIGANHKSFHVGYYADIEAAIIARKQAEQKYWGKDASI